MHIYTHIHSCTYTHNTYKYTHTTYTHTHIPIVHTNTYVHTYTYTYTHTYILTYTYSIYIYQIWSCLSISSVDGLCKVAGGKVEILCKYGID